jgi:hypothetical protein
MLAKLILGCFLVGATLVCVACQSYKCICSPRPSFTASGDLTVSTYSNASIACEAFCARYAR